MTDRIDALRALRYRVRSGEEFVGKFAEEECGFQRWQAVCIQKVTVDGSLDAARSLHEAVLPGWEWSVEADDQAEVWTHPEQGEDGKFFVRHSALSGWCSRENPARGWLLAILNALISQAEQSQ